MVILANENKQWFSQSCHFVSFKYKVKQASSFSSYLQASPAPAPRGTWALNHAIAPGDIHGSIHVYWSYFSFSAAFSFFCKICTFLTWKVYKHKAKAMSPLGCDEMIHDIYPDHTHPCRSFLTFGIAQWQKPRIIFCWTPLANSLYQLVLSPSSCWALLWWEDPLLNHEGHIS